MVAYFDETGSDEKSDVFGLACFVATERTWNLFLTHWLPVLSALRVSDIHMSALETRPRKGPYAHVSDAMWERAKRAIIAAFKVVPLRGFVSIIHKRDYKLYLAGPRTKRRYYQVKEAYILSMYQLLNKLAGDGSVELAADETIDLVFDRNEQIANHARAIYDDVLKELPDLARTFKQIRFGSRADAPPLQAADVLAYEYRRAMEMAWGYAPDRPRSIFDTLEATGRVNGEYLDREHMRFIQRNLPVLKKLLRLPEVERKLPRERKT